MNAKDVPLIYICMLQNLIPVRKGQPVYVPCFWPFDHHHHPLHCPATHWIGKWHNFSSALNFLPMYNTINNAPERENLCFPCRSVDGLSWSVQWSHTGVILLVRGNPVILLLLYCIHREPLHCSTSTAPFVRSLLRFWLHAGRFVT